jgi:hypothetical protein
LPCLALRKTSRSVLEHSRWALGSGPWVLVPQDADRSSLAARRWLAAHAASDRSTLRIVPNRQHEGQRQKLCDRFFGVSGRLHLCVNGAHVKERARVPQLKDFAQLVTE